MKLLTGHRTSLVQPVSGLGGGELFARLASWAGFLYLLQVLPPAEYGLLGIASAALSLLIPWVDIGWSAVGTREAAAHPEAARAWLKAITSRRVAVACGLFALVTAIAFQVSDRTLAGLIVGNGLFLFIGAFTPDWYLAARQRLGLLASARIVQGIVYVILVVWLVRGPSDILYQPLAGAASYALSIIVMLLGVVRHRGHVQPVRIPITEASILFGGTYALQSVASLAMLAVGIWAGSSEAGLLNAGLRFWVLGSVVASLPGLVVAPRLAAAGQDRVRLARAFSDLGRATTATALAAGSVALLASPSLTRLIAPMEYAPLASVLLVLLLGIGAQTVAQSAVRSLVMMQHTQEAARSQAVGVAFGLGALFLLVFRFGAMAGAMACVVAESITATMALLHIGRLKLAPSGRLNELFGVTLAAGVAAIVALIVARIGGLSDSGTLTWTALLVGGAWWWSLRPLPTSQKRALIMAPVSIELDAVVVSWNNGQWLERSVASLVASGVRPRRIVVVETGRDTKAQRALRRLPGGVRVLRRPDNPGYGAAVNAGAALLRSADPLLVMNADVEVSADGLRSLATTLHVWPRSGCATVRTHDEQGRDSTHTRRTTAFRLAFMMAFPRLWRLLRHVRGDRSVGGCRSVAFAEGSVLLVRRLAWDEVGGFDERFRFYGEDADLSTRLRKAGWSIVHDPSVSVLHAGRASFGRDELSVLPHLVEGLLLWTWTHAHGRFERVRRSLSAASAIRALLDRRLADRLACVQDIIARGHSLPLRELSAMSLVSGGRSFSVIVPTLGYRRALHDCLERLRRQLKPADELLVVMQGPARSRRGKGALSLGRLNRGRAKNVGARNASGTFLLFTDDDIRPPKDLLHAHRTYQREGPRAVTCRMVEPKQSLGSQKGPVLTVSRWGRVYTQFEYPERVRTGYAATGNMSISKALFAATGGFDESYRGTSVFEEADLGERLGKLGVEAWLEPTPVVQHIPDHGGNREERERSPQRYYYLFHHNLSYFYLKNRPRWQWILGAVTAVARSILQTSKLRRPLREAIVMASGYFAARSTMREIMKS